jgi:hypothetical protein
MWKLCSRTSDKRDQKTYSLLGCRHSDKVAGKGFMSDPEDWARVEKEWAEACVLLFDFKTQDWTETRVEEFREKLSDKAELKVPELPSRAETEPEKPAEPDQDPF